MPNELNDIHQLVGRMEGTLSGLDKKVDELVNGQKEVTTLTRRVDRLDWIVKGVSVVAGAAWAWLFSILT